MQIKTVKKVVKAKMEEWLSTIEDKALAKRVENSLMVSGGCITSLLTGQDVNDYDVYLSSPIVASDLAKYYTRDFNDVKVLSGFNKESLLKEFDDSSNPGHVFLEKISVENLQPEQVKLFFLSSTGGLEVNKGEPIISLSYEPLFFSPHAISLSDDLQIVLRFTGDHEEIHKNYDFIHATNYYTTEKGLVLNQRALESILTKQLVYQGSKYPLTSIIRVRKFIKRDWNINAGELLKIMFQISELDLKDPNVLEDQLIGVDVAYFSQLIALLRSRGDQELSSDYLNDLIDKVFSDSDETI